MPTFQARRTRAEPNANKGRDIVPLRPLPVHSPQKLSSSKRCYLLELSGELRNQIYNYVIEGRLVEIRPPADPNEELQCTLQFVNGILEINKPPKPWRFSDILGRRRRFDYSGTKWESSLSNLVLTCRQVNREASHFLYAKTSFVFESAKRTRAFLSVVQPVHKEVISRLHLVHRTYGQPFCLEHVTAKKRADVCWDRTCRSVAMDLKGLRTLEITLTVHDCPLILSLGEPWIVALLHFAQLELLNVKVNLQVPDNDGRYQECFARTSVGLDSFAETIRRKILRWDDLSALEAFDSARVAYNKAMERN